MTPKPRRTTRVSLLRVGVLLACVAAATWIGVRVVSEVTLVAPKPGPSTFSAYVDVTAWPNYPFETPAGLAQSHVNLAFIVSDPDRPCEPSWGGYYSLDGAASDLELDRRVQQLRDLGGDVRVSFGGALNSELSVACTEPDQLLAAYRSVVERYSLTGIDLDIEGAGLDDTAAMSRRTAAIVALQDERSSLGEPLTVWLTLPVGPDGLTAAGEATVSQMLAAGIDVAGVNGMTMDFGLATTAAKPQSETILKATNALFAQVKKLYADAGQSLNDDDAWGKVGMTPMIGQNDYSTERFMMSDAVEVNQFARDHGVGMVSMWSLNRDGTCVAPLPSVITVVQTSCSGINQGNTSFAETLAADLPEARQIVTTETTATPSPTLMAPVQNAVPPSDVIDDPDTSPYPIWDALGTYPAGTKIVWRHNVYQARFWSSGFAPDTPVNNPFDNPWTLLGPVLPGDTPAPLPTLPEGSYPEWDPETVYIAGDRVQVGLVPYEAKWWSQGTEPGVPVEGGSPWVLIIPAGQ
jgi:chitinase